VRISPFSGDIYLFTVLLNKSLIILIEKRPFFKKKWTVCDNSSGLSNFGANLWVRGKQYLLLKRIFVLGKTRASFIFSIFPNG